jgi:hypothetical protein
MSDLDGILEAITLEHLNAPGGPRRITVTAEGSTLFVRDTITEHHPIYGVHESVRWLPRVRSTATLTPRQIIGLAYSHQLQGWQEIGYAHHGMPNAGIVQR